MEKKTKSLLFSLLSLLYNAMKRSKSILLVAIVAFIAGAACEYYVLTYLWPNRHELYSWIFALRDYKALGQPCETDLVLDRQGYSLGYSYQYKTALWVSYIVSQASVSIDVGRHGSFYPDADVPEEYRAKLEDFVNTGYDKGHLAPSAAVDFSKEANRETFALSNIVLQDPKLNRQAWGKVEGLERDWTKTKGELHVIVGPVFTAKPKRVNGVALPSKFYKVIYAKDAEQAIGFLFPNKPVENADLWKYAMSVKELEKETGLNFFSALSDSTQTRLKEKFDIAWWKD